MPIVLDSITHMTAEHRGRAVLAMSHGGRYAGYYAARMGAGAALLNDAGIGRDQAGLAGVRLLGDLGVPAAALAARSARIGNGADGHAHGRVSFANAAAHSLGIEVGMTARAALDRLDGATLTPSPAPAHVPETRRRLAAACRPGLEVHAVDSVTLVVPADAGHIVVTGSHGGLLADRPDSALKVDVYAAVFSDAGFGKADAGVSRLPALEARGIAAACVSTFSCHIGDGASIWRDGVVSAANALALERGAVIGQSCRAFVAAMSAARG